MSKERCKIDLTIIIIPWKNKTFPTIERENKLLTPKKYHYLTYTLKQLPTDIPKLINKVSTSSHSIVK